MKKLIIALAALMVSVAAYGQGQFVFNNRIGTEVNARFITSGDPAAGTSSSVGSPDWTYQVLGGPVGGTLQPLTDPATPNFGQFRGAAGSSAAGFVVAGTPSVPGVGIGGTASVLVKILGPGGVSQDFGPFTVSGLGGGTTTPPNLQLGTTPLIVNTANVPEPTTLALGALGLGALLAFRRRN